MIYSRLITEYMISSNSLCTNFSHMVYCSLPLENKLECSISRKLALESSCLPPKNPRFMSRLLSRMFSLGLVDFDMASWDIFSLLYETSGTIFLILRNFLIRTDAFLVTCGCNIQSWNFFSFYKVSISSVSRVISLICWLLKVT